MGESEQPGGEQLRWRVHPAAERRLLAIVIAVLIVILAALAGVWMRGVYWGFFAALVLFLSLEAFFLPSTFELDAAGVRVRKPLSTVEKPWSAFRRVVFDPIGVTLSPFARRSWLEPYRALRLRYPQRGEPSIASVQRFVLAHIAGEGVTVIGASADVAKG